MGFLSADGVLSTLRLLTLSDLKIISPATFYHTDLSAAALCLWASTSQRTFLSFCRSFFVPLPSKDFGSLHKYEDFDGKSVHLFVYCLLTFSVFSVAVEIHFDLSWCISEFFSLSILLIGCSSLLIFLSMCDGNMVNEQTRAQTHMWECKYTWMHTHTGTYAYIFAHTHTFTCLWINGWIGGRKVLFS